MGPKKQRAVLTLTFLLLTATFTLLFTPDEEEVEDEWVKVRTAPVLAGPHFRGCAFARGRPVRAYIYTRTGPYQANLRLDIRYSWAKAAWDKGARTLFLTPTPPATDGIQADAVRSGLHSELAMYSDLVIVDGGNATGAEGEGRLLAAVVASESRRARECPESRAWILVTAPNIRLHPGRLLAFLEKAEEVVHCALSSSTHCSSLAVLFPPQALSPVRTLLTHQLRAHGPELYLDVEDLRIAEANHVFYHRGLPCDPATAILQEM